MAVTETGLGIDSNKLISRALSILPDRDRYFNDLIVKFKEKFPGLKLLYANNMTGARLDPERPNPDFVLICKGTLVSKDRRLPPKPIILMDMPMIFTDRSIAGWTIAVESGNMKGYFEYMLDKALRIDENKFYEFIQYMALLSLDPNDRLYWRKIENADTLIKDLEELYARYNKKGVSSRITDKRGYADKK